MRLFWILIAIVVAGMILLMTIGRGGTTFGIDNEAFAQTVIFVSLLTMFASGFLHSGRKIGPMIRNLLIWAVIIVLIAAAYVFRNDFSNAGDRLMSAFLPGRAIVTTSASGHEEVVLGKRQSGHFATRATVNGHALDMLVDTGASRVTLTDNDAKRIGLDTNTLNFSMMVQTANGSALAAPVTLNQIEIGPISRRNVQAMVVAKGKLSQSLLGMSFLSTLTSVDMRADQLYLTD
ncbi:TIGR02281 family clan AA aspartic protease [Martelella alba]|uniref:TIGR02281 family clan AA aspartic protease n=1 Tax=Martelella alba TaxID=2590451 RepID=A0A506U6A7_9HYPH|nr:TIGR02281 family clan AA aspartic protease [Martelella alba]TPW29380.1 TIGR02281 family clan AA aspartic protease [Martelella alba]